VRTGTSTEQAEERFRSVSCGVRVRGARASEVPFRPTANGRKGFCARRTALSVAREYDERTGVRTTRWVVRLFGERERRSDVPPGSPVE